MINVEFELEILNWLIENFAKYMCRMFMCYRYRYVHVDTPGRRRDRSTTAFRQEVYANNYWANPLSDLSGRYREITPQYYR